MDRFRSIEDSINEDHQVKQGKESELEKGDFLALMEAAWATIGKTALLVIAFFGLVIALLVLLWFH